MRIGVCNGWKTGRRTSGLIGRQRESGERCVLCCLGYSKGGGSAKPGARGARRLISLSAGGHSTSTGDKEANLALVKLRTLLERRRGTMLPASVVSPSSPPASPALAPPSPAAYPYAPFSVAAYHARLLTFSARSWTPKYRISGGEVQGASRSGPNASEGVVTVVLGDTDTDTNTDPLRPAEAARHGWVNLFPTSGEGVALAGAKANVLCCASCGVRWAVGCNAGELGALKQEWSGCSWSPR